MFSCEYKSSARSGVRCGFTVHFPPPRAESRLAECCPRSASDAQMVWAQRGSTKTQEEEQGEQAQTKGRGWRPRVLGRHGSAPPRLLAEEAARAEGGRVVRSGPRSAQCAWRGVAATTPHTRRGSRAHARARGHPRARAPGGGGLVARRGVGRGGDGGEGWRRACRGRGGVAPGLATGLATGWATGGDEWGRQAKVASSALMHVPLKTTILILPREVYQHGGPSGASTRPRRIG